MQKEGIVLIFEARVCIIQTQLYDFEWHTIISWDKDKFGHLYIPRLWNVNVVVTTLHVKTTLNIKILYTKGRFLL